MREENIVSILVLLLLTYKFTRAIEQVIWLFKNYFIEMQFFE